MIPCNYILRKCIGYNKFTKPQEKINCFTYMDVMKIIAKNLLKLETLISTINTYNQDIGMEFGIEKCVMLIMKKGKKRNNGKNNTPKSEKHQNTCKKIKLQVLGNTGNRHHQTEMKEKVKKRVPQKNNNKKKLLKMKFCSRNLIKGINTWAVSLVKYFGPFLKWTVEELRQMDERRRKFMTIVTGHKISILWREFILHTCDVGVVWHLTPCKISPSQDSCFGHRGTGK